MQANQTDFLDERCGVRVEPKDPGNAAGICAFVPVPTLLLYTSLVRVSSVSDHDQVIPSPCMYGQYREAESLSYPVPFLHHPYPRLNRPCHRTCPYRRAAPPQISDIEKVWVVDRRRGCRGRSFRSSSYSARLFQRSVTNAKLLPK